MRIEIGLSTRLNKPQQWSHPDPNVYRLNYPSISTFLGAYTRTAYLSRAKRWKRAAAGEKEKDEGCGASQRVSFRRGGRYYEHIYPKLENNEERLKPSQYFRCSKWTTSPAVWQWTTESSRRYYEPKMREWQCEKASLAERGRGTWIRAACAHPAFYTFCAALTRQEISTPLS